MASELAALGRAAARLARQSPMTADLTRAILTRAIKAIVACFPVYRTYVDLSGGVAETDRRDIAWAIARARRLDPDVHASAFDFLENLLAGGPDTPTADGIGRTAALRFAMKLQQFSGPVMAKGVEDTAFYRYNRFVALNDVGGAPERFGIAPPLFHKANAQRAERWPHAMLATATHDTKRGEDARARLAVLSELPEEWRRQVSSWSRLLRARLGDVEGRARARPRRRIHVLPDAGRLLAVRTARVSRRRRAGSLSNPHSCRARKGVAGGKASLELGRAQRRIRDGDAGFRSGSAATGGRLPDGLSAVRRRVARLGVQNSLVQTALKLTAPGVPDIYQGCELWDLSLVDPDNRRPVDYREREAALAALRPRLEAETERAGLFESLLTTWPDGRIKLALTALLLGLRRDRPELFAEGDYAPIETDWRGRGLGGRFRPRVRAGTGRGSGGSVSRPAGGEAGLAGAGADAGRRMVRRHARAAVRRPVAVGRVARGLARRRPDVDGGGDGVNRDARKSGA